MKANGDPASNTFEIVSLGVEGGGARVFGRLADGVWTFWCEGSAMQDIDAEEEWKEWSTSPVANLVDALPRCWIQMFPIEIDPRFRESLRGTYKNALAALMDYEIEIHERHIRARWKAALEGENATENPMSTSMDSWILLRFHIAGFRFHAGMALSEMMRPGDPLSLVAEPDNPHDPRAVRLDFGDMHVGYVPRDHNTIIATLLAQGAPLECRIVSITLDVEPWKMIEAEIRLVRRAVSH